MVGTWEVKTDSQCLKFDGQTGIGYLGLTCKPNIAHVKGSIKVTGKLTLGPDKKYTEETVTTGAETWDLDKSCLILSGTQVNCESIGTTFEGALKGFGYETMVCKDASSGGGCTCDDKINTEADGGRPGGMAILYNDATTKGSYRVEGNKLSIGDSLSYSYCVKGSEMTLSPIPVENGGATPYKGTIVLTRKDAPTGGSGGSSSSQPGSSGGETTASSSSRSTSSSGGSTAGGTSTGTKGGSGGSTGGVGGGGTTVKAGNTTGGTSAVGGTSAGGGGAGGSSSSTSTCTGAECGKDGPCDIYKAANMPCASAYSMIRKLSKDYKGPLFQVRAGSSSSNNTMSGGTTRDVMPGDDGFVDSATVDKACEGGSYCTVSVLYDHSGNGNDIKRGPKGSTAGGDRGDDDDYESIATKGQVKAGGHNVYSLYMKQYEGYRSTVVGKNMPTGQQPQGTYMLADGTRKASACCWDFGNVTTKPATEWAFMDTICLGHTFWGNSKDSNWFGFGIDFEGGVWAGGTKEGDPGYGALNKVGPTNTKNPTMGSAKFALGFIRVSPNEYAIRVADLATATDLTEAYKGGMPVTIGHKGGIVLGVGGDNSNNSQGTFYEGAMVAGYPTNDVEAAVMKNIKEAGYTAAH